MTRDFAPVLLDGSLRNDLAELIRLGMAEDVADLGDVTTLSTVPEESRGRCEIVSRQSGIAAGVMLVPWIIETLNCDLEFSSTTKDGTPFQPHDCLGVIAGSSRDILSAERLILNIVSRLCGVATLTQQYATRIAEYPARLYDTRKTTVGWRRLEKYAVRCGGGHNHRTGLYDAILIKDNHLALGGDPLSPADAIERSRRWIEKQESASAQMIIEIEVDSIEQLKNALPAQPDIILIDNFSIPQLVEAVALRDQIASEVELEASGGVTIETIGSIAKTGVDRISCGAISHQATWLDLGLDWVS